MVEPSFKTEEGIYLNQYPERRESTRSTLGVIQSDKGHHDVRFSSSSGEQLIVNQSLETSEDQKEQDGQPQEKKKQSLSSDQRRLKWQRLLEKRKSSMEKEMEEVKKIVQIMSLEQPYCARRQHTFAANERYRNQLVRYELDVYFNVTFNSSYL